jgi:secreted PhoX family phosphatase
MPDRSKAGMEKIASRLEARRYAAMMGATTEFRKEEGITFDPDTKRIYVAMSEVNSGAWRTSRKMASPRRPL